MVHVVKAPVAPQSTPLYHLVIQLDAALNRGEGYLLVRPALAELLDYCRTSLARLYTHAPGECRRTELRRDALCQRLARQSQAWMAEYQNGAPILAAEILYFLRDWLRQYHRLAQPLAPAVEVMAA